MDPVRQEAELLNLPDAVSWESVQTDYHHMDVCSSSVHKIFYDVVGFLQVLWQNNDNS